MGASGVTTAEVGANALAGDGVNVAAGYASGGQSALSDFVFGVSGNLIGSTIGIATQASDNFVFGARGTGNAFGDLAANLFESTVAAGGSFLVKEH